MKPRVILGACLALSCWAGAAARGETISVRFTGVSPGKNVSVYYDRNGPGSGGASTITVGTGAYNWVPTVGSTNAVPFDQPFQSFCIDFDQFVQSPVTFTVAPLEAAPVTIEPGAAGSGPSSTAMSAAQANWLRELWGERRAELDVGTASQRADRAAAFQLAVWELLFESSTTRSLSNGYFKVPTSGPPGYVTLANDYLATTLDAGYDPVHFETNLVALTSSSGQDHLTVRPAAVPLPSAAGMGLVPLGGLVMKRSGRRRDGRLV